MVKLYVEGGGNTAALKTDCHLMVQCMESWLLADDSALKAFFGQGFREARLPASADSIEVVSKSQIYDALADAVKGCKTKAQYGKGEHSFKLLARIDPAKVIAASRWVKRPRSSFRPHRQCPGRRPGTPTLVGSWVRRL